MDNLEDQPKIFKPYLYRRNSLRETNDKVLFVLDNSSGENIGISKVEELSFNGRFVSLDDFILINIDKKVWKPALISPQNILLLQQNIPIQFIIRGVQLGSGTINIRFVFLAQNMGRVIVDVNETIEGE